MRHLDRLDNQLRPIVFEAPFTKYAEGSCLVKCGDTHVLCTATVEEKVPPFLRNKGTGWITAEYGMLPRATHLRVDREAAKGKQTGRTQEIQRLIGRSLRAIIDLGTLGERQIRIDCDVIQADGGTRTAAINGSFIALHLAIQNLLKNGVITKSPIKDHVAAVSCGIIGSQTFLDLDYAEDSTANVDANFVFTGSGQIVEIQSTAEGAPFSHEDFLSMFTLAQLGIAQIVNLQKKILGIV